MLPLPDQEIPLTESIVAGGLFLRAVYGNDEPLAKPWLYGHTAKTLQGLRSKMSMKMTSHYTCRTLWAVISSAFFAALGISLMSFVLPLISMDARVSGAWLGTGFAGFFLARMLAGPLAGFWADKVGGRFPLLVGAGFGAASPLLYFIHPGVVSLYCIQFVLGVVSGMVRPVGLAVLGGNSGEDGKKWFAAHSLAFHGALFVGPLLSGVLYWNRSVELVLVGVAVCMVLAHLVIFAFVPSSTESRRDTNDPVEELDSRTFRALFFGIFGRSLSIGVTMAFYPLLLSMEVGGNPLLIGTLFCLPSLFACLGLLYLPKVIPAQWSDLGVATLGMAISLGGVMKAGVSDHFIEFIMAGFLIGIGAAFSIPPSMKLASQAKGDQGRVFGVVHLVTGAGLITGPLLGGLAFSAFGSLTAVFTVVSCVGFLLLYPMSAEWRRLRGIKEYVSKRLGIGVALVLFGPLLILWGWMVVEDGSLPVEREYKYSEIAMGTVVNLTLEADSKWAADNAARKAIAFMHTLQADLDHRSGGGSIARINMGAGKYGSEPTSRAYGLIKRAVELAEKTDGAFDPTIGALTTTPLYYVLDKTVAESKKHLVDFRKVRFRDGLGEVRLAEKGMALDLGGIAKGAIIDATVKLLRKQRIKAGIVEAGGDFYCFGDRYWTVGIRHPREEKIHTTVTVREKGVCGSGDYQQFVKTKKVDDTSILHHIINPDDMGPVSEVVGVTVIAGSAELADGLATALFVMGPKDGERLLRESFPEVGAQWFTPDMKVVETESFPK